MKKKTFALFFIIAFFVTIGVKLFSSLSSFDVSKGILLNEHQTYTIEKNLHNGCYEVGFYSKDKLFFFPMYEPYTFKDSQFEVKLFDKGGKELKKTNIDKNSRLQHGFNRGRITSGTANVALELFKVPLQGANTIKAQINVKQLNDKFKNKEVYLYFHKYSNTCNMKRLAMVNKKHTYPINKAETNTTLIPLYKALTSKDTQKVKTILDANESLCDSNFIGDRTVFHYSAFLDDIKTLTYLEKECTKKLLHKPDILTKTPLVYAIENNATKVLDFLFEHGGTCPESIENTYFKKSIGPSSVYKKDAWGDNFTNFVHEYNLPEIADALLKKECMNIDKKMKAFGGGKITWVELMERDMRGTQQMKKENDPRWKTQKDYTKLIKVFKKYTKDTNTTQRINDGK
ncbi:ankyrin repeat domain-containing protein [Sulfurospirillum arcachonense]|uniref:ankyrin repeat domain-containing protein n=1 Tax=Sulfurospirillum arcachonense TaxID=57666 RepID=UPI000469CF73|nr:ankyrin repeat domain-containing protein [Sulfurospirillum arcachonense]